MPEQEIRFCTTTDGIRIAFWAIGEGPPLLHLPWGTLSNCQGEWRMEDCRRWYERLARRSTVIRFDPRGCGMSDPIAGSVSVDDLVSDIEAVLTSLGLKQVALLAVGESGNTAMAYAAKHTDGVSRLGLWCCYARPSDREQSPGYQATTALVDQDPVIFSETVSRIVLGWSAGEEEARALAAGIRAVGPGSMRVLLDTFHTFDASRLLPMITAPTLVMHRRGWRNPGLDAARVLAAGIPNARMLVLEGDSGLPYAGDMEEAAVAVEGFLGESSVAGFAVGLSRREAEILGLLAVGKSNLEISSQLFLSLRTVERHITNVFRKLGVRNRAEATAYACKYGLV
jgi:pimeloyl-ACP methyl ester carboxylesterase/DNA-binding CsgD family transcriptional regulator